MASGIYNEPLPTVRGTGVEIFNELALWTLTFIYLLLLALYGYGASVAVPGEDRTQEPQI